MFPSYTDFGVRYCAGKLNGYGWDHTGSSNMGELQQLLKTIMIRRLKSEVWTRLPNKIRQKVVVKLDPIELACTQHGKPFEKFRETGRAKVEAVKNYVKELVERGKKFLCFAHHKCVLDGISEALEDITCSHVRIDGDTPSKDRERLVKEFQQNDNCLVAVLSITASAGITLTAASLVVFAELFWNPGILTQAEDRAHRIGQENCVIVQYLVAKGTADDEIWKSVKDKSTVLNNIGLSNDNFEEVGESVLTQPLPNQHPYFGLHQNKPHSSERQTGFQEFPCPSPFSRESKTSKNQFEFSDNQNSLRPIIGSECLIQMDQSRIKPVIGEHCHNALIRDQELLDTDSFLDDTLEDDADDETSLFVPQPENECDNPLDALDSPFGSQTAPNNQDDHIRNEDDNDEAVVDQKSHGHSEIDLAMEGDDSLLASINMEYFMDKSETDSNSVHATQKLMPSESKVFFQDDEIDVESD